MKKISKLLTIAAYTLAVLGGWHSEAAAGGSEPTVSVTRLVVADGVSEREPLGVATEFSIAETERLFAFVEVSNPSAEPTEILVSWTDSATGTADRPPYALQVGAGKRWRTWARTAAPRKPGTWDVVLADAAGNELARTQFTMKE